MKNFNIKNSSFFLEKKYLKQIDDFLLEKKINKKISFSSSIKISKEVMKKEDENFLKNNDNTFISFKGKVNLEIRKFLEEKGFQLDKDPDILIIVDFEKEKTTFKFLDKYIFGRYSKYKQMLQAGIDDETVEKNIFEMIKKINLKPISFHASGREDFDVLCVGSRPFVIKIKGNEKIMDLPKKMFNGNVLIKDLKFCKKQMLNMVTDSAFKKEYIAFVEFEKEIDEKNINNILKIKEILQKTPKRVTRNRAILTRKKKINFIKIIKKQKKNVIFFINSQSGTYIKELISGDDNRTSPSFSSVCLNKAICKKLFVVNILDFYLDILGDRFV